MRNSDYWKQRFVQLEKAQNSMGTSAYAKIERQYKQAQKQIEAHISMWYQRFAKNNGITLSEARQWLTGKDLKEFQWDVKEYIKRGEEYGISGKWAKELENASAKFHISKLEALKIQTQQSLESLFGSQQLTLFDEMGKVYKSGYYHTAFELQRGFNIGWDIAGLNQSEIEKILAKPWAPDKYNFSERIWKNKTKLINEVHKELTQNILTGADPQKAIDAIAKKMNASRYNAGRLVMTEEAYFSSAAQRDCFNELNVEQYEIVATLDSHTSEICQELDGKHFPMKDYQAGVTAPPFHVNCRSTAVPYFDDNFGQIGQRAARDKETGKTYYVPDNLTYEDWKQAFADGGSKEGLTNGGGSGIIKEMGQKPITEITDTAINRVPKVDVPGYTDEQCEFIQEQHRELLRYSRDNNGGKEVAFVFRKDLSGKTPYTGTDDSLDFGNALFDKGSGLFVMHNHPRNSSFSDTDIAFLLGTDNVKTLSIVKNNGSVECLTKTHVFNKDELILDFKRQYKKFVKTGSDSEIDKAVKKFIERNKEGLAWNKNP